MTHGRKDTFLPTISREFRGGAVAEFQAPPAANPPVRSGSTDATKHIHPQLTQACETLAHPRLSLET